MRLLNVFLILVIPCVPLYCSGNQLKDQGLLPITKEELSKRIQQTPISSPEHSILLSRAYVSHLQQTAYEQYTIIWQKHQNDPNANLLRGLSAQDYWQHAMMPEAGQPGESRIDLSEANEYQRIIRSCLAKSVELSPGNARANMAYGFFLWQWDSQMNEGLALMNKAVQQAPSLPTLHAVIAEVYLNPSTKSYNLESAEKEIKTAIRLDPGYASPHLSLVRLYCGKKQPDLAQKELREYLSLAPPEIAQASWIKWYQVMIDYCKR